MRAFVPLEIVWWLLVSMVVGVSEVPQQPAPCKNLQAVRRLAHGEELRLSI